MLQDEIPYGKPDRAKAGIKVLRDSTTSYDFSEVSQDITVSSSQGASEGRTRNREIRDKHRFEPEGYFEKYYTTFSSAMNLDNEQLLMAMTEAVLNPDIGTTSYKVLEIEIDMLQVPTIDKCNLFKCFSNILKDEVMQLSTTLRKLQSKHSQVLENFRKEKINSHALTNDIHTLRDVIKGKGKGISNPQSHLIKDLQKQVAALKSKINIPGSHHV